MSWPLVTVLGESGWYNATHQHLANADRKAQFGVICTHLFTTVLRCGCVAPLANAVSDTDNLQDK